ncbi:hypothetical protein P7H75_13990 [Vagococcus carniphilus]|uniref:hypothetical protein n=1 Tax=Vagococcus carniphilus TaxID=218144 RepID=UPI002891536F|nr:hypothetical protein [Vagococcus carniphilus]MDT2815966.1 hypothetical protein [Vagococcus carniphilus]
MNLIDYIIEGYTIVVPGHGFYRTIRNKYPEADVMLASSDGIGGNKLLIDRYCKEIPSVKSATYALRKENVVYENFTRDFVNGPTIKHKQKYNAKEIAEAFDINFDHLVVGDLKEYCDLSIEYIEVVTKLHELSLRVKERENMYPPSK